MYTVHHFRNIHPYFKGEMGFAGLAFPHKPTSTYHSRHPHHLGCTEAALKSKPGNICGRA